MVISKLSAQHKKLLKRASPAEIVSSFSELRRHTQASAWLGRRNRYKENTVKRVESDFKNAVPINDRHLRQYIVASGPIHCLDGWAFLGRAMIAHLHGDPDVSRHLAYYGELRAAMSLLAIQGIGIFASRHAIVDDKSKCFELAKLGDRKGTHKIAWLALDHWSGLSRSMNVLSAAVAPYGIPFSEWLSAFGAGTQMRPIASAWFKHWGLDLQQFSDDREARNESSYRPTTLTPKASLSAISASKFLASFWRTHEPTSTYQPAILDTHLLRQGIERAFEAREGRKPSDRPQEFEVSVRKMVEILNPPGAPKDVLVDFFMRKTDPDTNLILQEAEKSTALQDARHHLQVMSRATLLLRVATGACAALFRQAGYKRSDLEFWWRDVGINRGYWESSSVPDPLTDLWADIEDALTSLEGWIAQNEVHSPSMFSFSSTRSSRVELLSGCERIGLWGLGF